MALLDSMVGGEAMQGAPVCNGVCLTSILPRHEPDHAMGHGGRPRPCRRDAAAMLRGGGERAAAVWGVAASRPAGGAGGLPVGGRWRGGCGDRHLHGVYK